jgi:hypothetical protein
MSLERLIRLAKKTGDTLIVHTPGERDLVIMDVDAYEALQDIREINSITNMDMDCDDLSFLDDPIRENLPSMESDNENDFYGIDDSEIDDEFVNPFSQESPWSSTREVIDEQKQSELEDWATNNIPDLSDWEIEKKDEIKIEDLPFDPPMMTDKSSVDSNWDLPTNDVSLNIPINNSIAEIESWDEELLGEEEPVFYEEPV